MASTPFEILSYDLLGTGTGKEVTIPDNTTSTAIVAVGGDMEVSITEGGTKWPMVEGEKLLLESRAFQNFSLWFYGDSAVDVRLFVVKGVL